ncbi:MAG: carboxypeptidase regulatory-like domain-containing protein [bacterium]
MRFRRVLIVFGVMIGIVLLGMYWEGQQLPSGNNPPGQTDSQSVESPDINTNNWNLPEAARVSFETSSTTDTATQYGGLTIPGQVTFAGSQPQSIRLTVDILPLSPSRARRLQQKNLKQLESNLTSQSNKGSFRNRRIQKTVQANQKGQFSLVNAPVGVYRVTSNDTNWSGGTQRAILQTPSQTSSIQFSVKRTGTLHGRIIDPDREPIPNVKISLTTKPRNLGTDQNGEFTLHKLQPNRPIDFLKISKSGYQSLYPSLPPLNPGETRRDTFVLKKNSTLTVTVRSQTGRPVTDGDVVVKRLDSKKLKTDDPNSLRDGKLVQPLNEDGKVTIPGIQPGQVKVGLTFSNYLTDPRTVEIKPGETRKVSLKALEGRKTKLQFKNNQTGERVKGIRPIVTVYDARGKQLSPGFELKHVGDNGKIEAVVHPNINRLKIRSEATNFKPKTTSFTRSDLPEISVGLTPLSSRTGDETPPGMLKVNLSASGTFNWDQVQEVQAYVLDRETGQRHLGRAGHRSVFEEPFPLQEGQYLLYGIIETRSNNYTVFESIDVESQHPGQISVTPVPSAGITGRLLSGESSRDNPVGVGISLLPPATGNQSPSRDIYYPTPLTDQPDENGNFSISTIPPGSEFSLHVLVGRSGSFSAAGNDVILSEPLPILSRGESRTLSTINLTK